jgi:hypothetical protein
MRLGGSFALPVLAGLNFFTAPGGQRGRKLVKPGTAILMKRLSFSVMPQLQGVERALRRAFIQRAQSARSTFGAFRHP